MDETLIPACIPGALRVLRLLTSPTHFRDGPNPGLSNQITLTETDRP